MSLEPYQQKMLELMKEQELLMADIYLKLSELFPRYADEYRAMIAEEVEHAGWIEYLRKLCSTEKVRFAEGNTRTYTINSMITYLKDLKSQLDAKRPNHLKSLTLILDLEQSLIERNAFQRFKGDSSEVEKVLMILEDSQKSHIAKIRDFMSRVKATSTGADTVR